MPLITEWYGRVTKVSHCLKFLAIEKKLISNAFYWKISFFYLPLTYSNVRYGGLN